MRYGTRARISTGRCRDYDAAMIAPSHPYGASAYATTPDGRRLHYMSAGSAEPTVVFESGMGMSRSSWGLVQPRVAQHVRAVVYDRAGTGRSEDATTPRTLAALAADLRVLLDALGSGPFVLVGHSWGGPIVRTAAALVPQLVAGIVLVDQTDEHCELFFAANAQRRFALMRRLVPLAACTGLYRLAARPGAVQPAIIAAEHRADDFGRRAARAMIAEIDLFPDELRVLRAAPPRLPDVPMSVISGTLSTRFDRAARRGVVAAHQATAASMPRGRFVAATRSAHLVMFSEPEVVVAEVLRVAGVTPL